MPCSSNNSSRATCLETRRVGVSATGNYKPNNTHLSLTASCHLINFATSLTWKPKMRGRYRSAFRATVAVLIPSLPRSAGGSSSRTFLLRRVSASALRESGPNSTGPLLGGMRPG